MSAELTKTASSEDIEAEQLDLTEIVATSPANMTVTLWLIWNGLYIVRLHIIRGLNGL